MPGAALGSTAKNVPHLPQTGDRLLGDDREHRKFVYGFARDALLRKATEQEIEYALELLGPLTGHKALGFKVRLTRKMKGESWTWKDL